MHCAISTTTYYIKYESSTLLMFLGTHQNYETCCVPIPNGKDSTIGDTDCHHHSSTNCDLVVDKTARIAF